MSAASGSAGDTDRRQRASVGTHDTIQTDVASGTAAHMAGMKCRSGIGYVPGATLRQMANPGGSVGKLCPIYKSLL